MAKEVTSDPMLKFAGRTLAVIFTSTLPLTYFFLKTTKLEVGHADIPAILNYQSSGVAGYEIDAVFGVPCQR